MLYRKIAKLIETHLTSDSKKILLIDGARQVGKTYIIRHVGKKLFESFIEINMVEDSLGDRLFANTNTVEDFYLQVSMLYGDKMKDNTLIFIDEIQAYPQLLTLLKFLSQDNRFTYIASGSLLGVTLSQTTSIPKVAEIIRLERAEITDYALYTSTNNKGISIVVGINKLTNADLAPQLLEILIPLIHKLFCMGKEQYPLTDAFGIQYTNSGLTRPGRTLNQCYGLPLLTQLTKVFQSFFLMLPKLKYLSLLRRHGVIYQRQIRGIAKERQKLVFYPLRGLVYLCVSPAVYLPSTIYHAVLL